MVFTLRARHLALLSTLLAGSPMALFAISANPVPFVEQQPDGTAVTLQVKGGEFLGWLEDSKGFPCLRRSDGTIVYAAQDGTTGDLVPTKYVVGRDDPKAAGIATYTPTPGQRLAARALAERGEGPGGETAARAARAGGVLKNLVVLCRFSDHSAAAIKTASDYDKLWNAAGGDPSVAPSGSVRDVFLENSYGALDVQSTVVGPVVLPQTEAWYTNGNSGLSSGQGAQQMVRDALLLADPLVNFSDFDQDSDGWIDAIDIIHSGYGAEFNGNTGRIWSHKWQLYTTFTSAEGVRVSPYHTEPALWGSSGTSIGRIGVAAHETGHFLGLPDLYDTDSTSEGIGNWCLMAAGSWGFDNSQYYPSHFSAWCKSRLGWVTPVVDHTNGIKSLPAVETTAAVNKITLNFGPNEYLLVENRRGVGFDRNVPSGLAIWHIDDNVSGNTNEGYPGQSGWPGNARHYRVALLQADGLYEMEHNSNRGNTGDVFRAAGVNSLTPATVPSTDAYSAGHIGPTGITIDSISAPGATMTYNFVRSTPGISPTTDSSTEMYAGDPAPTVTSFDYTLDNPGTSDLAYSLAPIASAWLTATPASGTITAGGTVPVTATFTAAASTLTTGNYQQTLAYTIGSTSVSRKVLLQVYPAVPFITSGAPQTDSVSFGLFKWYRIVVPANQSLLTLSLTGPGSSDASLYQRLGSRPTTGSYDRLSATPGTSTESIAISNPTAGTHFIGVYGNNLAAYTLTATLTGAADVTDWTKY